MQPTAVLAFSGGLDTSFCVPFLIEKGYRVVTVFVDTGGGDPQSNKLIEQRALDLGASAHRTHNASRELWDQFVVPFVMGGVPYQDQYPLLCSDRYAIAAAVATIAEEVGAEVVAHGCTAMGNDQVRFDHSLRCLTALPVIAPIREVQALSDSPRDYEIAYLEERGHEVSADVKRYTINENLLGATISGSEIDRYEAPGAGARRLTSPPEEWPTEPVVAPRSVSRKVSASPSTTKPSTAASCYATSTAASVPAASAAGSTRVTPSSVSKGESSTKHPASPRSSPPTAPSRNSA